MSTPCMYVCACGPYSVLQVVWCYILIGDHHVSPERLRTYSYYTRSFSEWIMCIIFVLEYAWLDCFVHYFIWLKTLAVFRPRTAYKERHSRPYYWIIQYHDKIYRYTACSNIPGITIWIYMYQGIMQTVWQQCIIPGAYSCVRYTAIRAAAATTTTATSSSNDNELTATAFELWYTRTHIYIPGIHIYRSSRFEVIIEGKFRSV